MMKIIGYLQNLQEKERRGLEKVDLACSQNGSFKVAGRTEITLLKDVFCMKIVDEQDCSQENEEKGYMEIFFVFCDHEIYCA